MPKIHEKDNFMIHSEPLMPSGIITIGDNSTLSIIKNTFAAKKHIFFGTGITSNFLAIKYYAYYICLYKNARLNCEGDYMNSRFTLLKVGVLEMFIRIRVRVFQIFEYHFQQILQKRCTSILLGSVKCTSLHSH